MITRADFAGDIVMDDVVVDMVAFGPGEGAEGDDGCVRSNPSREEWSQKLEGVPMRALRGGFAGIVDDMTLKSMAQDLQAQLRF